jgi:hypothetical protein
MYLVPVLVAVDAPDATAAETVVAAELLERAGHVDRARRLTALTAAVATFHLLVYANGIELPPADPRRR